MNLTYSKLNSKNINIIMITIGDIDFIDPRQCNKILEIIISLTNGNKYFFELNSEDHDFFDDEELNFYRVNIPDFFNKNGTYIIKEYLDEVRYGAIACLPTQSYTYEMIINIWKYYYGVCFFVPSEGVDWTTFDNTYRKVLPELWGVGFLEHGFTDALFIKGHDGDNLIFVCNADTLDINFTLSKMNNIIMSS